MTGKTSFEIIKDYDVQNDVLYFRIIDKYEYKESIELNNNIILDFDENNMPVALEILDASNVLKVSKFSLLNLIKWKMAIYANEDWIKVEILTLMPIKQKNVEKSLLAKTINDINMPTLEKTHFNLATIG